MDLSRSPPPRGGTPAATADDLVAHLFHDGEGLQPRIGHAIGTVLHQGSVDVDDGGQPHDVARCGSPRALPDSRCRRAVRGDATPRRAFPPGNHPAWSEPRSRGADGRERSCAPHRSTHRACQKLDGNERLADIVSNAARASLRWSSSRMPRCWAKETAKPVTNRLCR